jgi:serine/threonine protein kinase
MMALPEGAHLTYRELLDAADQPKPAVQEDYRSMARIARAFRYDDASIAAAAGEGASPQIYMHREEKPFQAYALTGRSINLNHHHPDWGHVHFGFVMPRRGEHFVVPSNRNEVKHVAIKQLRKSVFHQAIALGGPNNPYKEVAFLQELGDDIHVLRPIEALEDDEFLYIVTPRGLATLVEAIPWNSPQTLEPNRIRSIFRQLLEIQAYLLRHKVCHRDLSPDNFLFLTEDNLVVFDFGYSLRIPVDDQTGRRYLMQEQGVFGTPPYMSPEVRRAQVPTGSWRWFSRSFLDAIAALS